MGILAASQLHILGASLLLTIFFNHLGREHRDFTSLAFLNYLIWLLLFLFAENASYLMMLEPPERIAEPRMTALLHSALVLKYCLLNMVIYHWAIYSESLEDAEIVLSRQFRLKAVTPAIIYNLINLTNFATHWLFSIRDGIVRYHNFYPVQMVLMSVGMCCLGLRKTYFGSFEPDPLKKESTNNAARVCYMFSIALVFGAVTFGEPVLGLCFVLPTVMRYYMVLSNEVSMDPLTGINNRKMLRFNLGRFIEQSGEKTWLFMMDIDYFKSINDNFGHVEGDNALIEVTKILKESLNGIRPKPFLTRYGGDEFVIVGEFTQEEAERLQKDIRWRLRVMNNYLHLPYNLSTSIGAASFAESDVRNGDELLKKADSRLYEIKKARPEKQ